MTPTSIHTIFEACRLMEQEGWTCKVFISIVQIYNDVIQDVLSKVHPADVGDGCILDTATQKDKEKRFQVIFIDIYYVFLDYSLTILLTSFLSYLMRTLQSVFSTKRKKPVELAQQTATKNHHAATL